MSFEVKTVITDEDMRDIVIAGFECGSYSSLLIVGYVAKEEPPKWGLYDDGSEYPRYAWQWDLGIIQVRDKYGDGERGTITRFTLQKGLELLRDKHPRMFFNLMNDDYDAIDADALLQAAAFGEVLYG